jgi:peroxiredoxin
MKRLAILLLIVTLLFVTAVFGACTNNIENPDTPSTEQGTPGTGPGDGPIIVNPGEGGGNGGGSEDPQVNTYTISIVSKGGLNLNGVRVRALKGSTQVKSGISINGKVDLAMPLDEYTLEFSNLPNGYFIPEGTTYVTSATSNKYTAIFESKVIETTAPSGFVYRVGDVMHDFTFSETEGGTYTLSQLLEEKKAVMLNFWYRGCQPCRAEFPAIETAYQSYKSDLEIVALSHDDGMQAIAAYKTEMSLSFMLGRDPNSSLGKHFGVTAYPTTVIIDRYGVVAHVESGNITDANVWKSLFDNYTSDDYIQTPGDNNDDNEDDEPVIERVEPNVTMPSSDTIASAIGWLDGRYYPEETDEYSWPFMNGGETGSTYVYASNVNVNNSYAILYVDLELNEGDVLSYEYNVNTEENGDILYVLINREDVAYHTGNSNGWKSQRLYVAQQNQSISLAFVYMKDTEVSAENEFAGIRNLNITQINLEDEAIDMLRVCASGTTTSSTKYDNYTQVILGDDGYYHVKNADGTAGPLLFADLRGITPWAELRWDERVYTDDRYNTQYYYSLYDLSFWYLPAEPNDDSFIYNGNNYNQLMYDSYEMQGWVGLIPVDESLKNMMNDFAIEFNKREGKGYNSNTWLEFCYYYEHYGQPHANGLCGESHNPVLGMVFSNAFEVKADVITEANNKYPLQINRGVKFKFTPERSGAYAFKTLATGSVDPAVYIFDEYRRELASQDCANDYDRFSNPAYGNNAQLYIYLEEGQTVYVSMALFMPGDVGKYDFVIEFLGESAKKLVHMTTGEGLWTTDLATGKYVYIAEQAALNEDDGYYHHVTRNGEFGSIAYINFAHPNFFDGNGHTLLEIIEAGEFDFSKQGGADYTQKLLNYYYESIEGRTPKDELYGMVPANQELVTLLNHLVLTYQQEGPETMAWRQFACYYQYLGDVEDTL